MSKSTSPLPRKTPPPSTASAPARPPTREPAWLSHLDSWVQGNMKRCRTEGVSLKRRFIEKPSSPVGGWPWKQAALYFCREANISVGTLAARMGLSRTYLNALFKLQHGWKRRQGSLIQALRITSSDWQAQLDLEERDYHNGRRK